MHNPILDDSGTSIVGLRLIIVEAGTTITDNQSGRSETVQEDGAVKAGGAIYCTKPVYDLLVAAAKKMGIA